MTKKQDTKTYFCPYLGREILGVVARSCNYSNLETYTCNHNGKPCVAKEGLEIFEQKPIGDTGLIFVDFKAAGEALEEAKRQKRYERISSLADYLFPDDNSKQ